MGMAHNRSIGAVRNKKIAPRFSTVSSWKTRPRQDQHPRPHRLQVCTPWTPKSFLGAPGAAAVQQSAAEECDQRTRTASWRQWRAELQSFQKEPIGGKSKCWKFLGGRFALTQSCLRSCSHRSAGCWGFSWNILIEKHWVFSILLCSAMLYANNTTISKVRRLRRFGSSLILGEQHGSKHETTFQIQPSQRQGAYSVQAQYCHCHTNNFPNKPTIPSKPQALHLVFWRVLHIAPEALPTCSSSIATHTSAQPVRCTACKSYEKKIVRDIQDRQRSPIPRIRQVTWFWYHWKSSLFPSLFNMTVHQHQIK